MHDVNNARSMPRARCTLFIFFGGKTYRMPGMYLPRITELAMLEHEQEKQRRGRDEERTSREMEEDASRK